MVYLKLLLSLYVSFMLIWSLVLIYYLYTALVHDRRPTWLKTIINNGGSGGEVVLYGSVIVSPILIVFATIMVIKNVLFGGRKK